MSKRNTRRSRRLPKSVKQSNPDRNWLAGIDDRVRREIVAIVLIAGAVLMYVALRSPSGAVGTFLQSLLRALFGQSGALIAPGLVLLAAIKLLFGCGQNSWRPRLIGLATGLAALLLWLQRDIPVTTLAVATNNGLAGFGGGLLGAWLSWLLVLGFGQIGRDLFIAALALVTVPLTLNFSWGRFAMRAGSAVRTGAARGSNALREFLFVEVEDDAAAAEPGFRDVTESNVMVDEDPEQQPQSLWPTPTASDNGMLPASGWSSTPVEATDESPAAPAAEVPAGLESYRLPPLSLLQRGRGGKPLRSQRESEAKGKQLEQTLENFGVKARVVGVQHGPAVTRFELEPATGVRVSRIQSLANDIALSLAAPDIRIEAPIPGKSLVGIEVPNPEISPVNLRNVLEAPQFRNITSPLTIAFGMDIAGQAVIAPLDKMPHVLIAGATGSGKSVCVNVLLASLLYKARPEEVRLLLVDPKVVELSSYNGIPHLLVPVVTDPKRAAAALQWLVKEMERRYEVFAEAGVRDINRYNVTIGESGGERLPYIVVVIDELADLMMVAPVDVEDAIQRLAQMARAAGIHLVVATQRPSVDVITGVIKANIPSRIAFAVSSQTDSRVILDMAGAEKLVGKGDMLFYPMGAAKPVRVQGAYLSESELDVLLEFVRNQARPEYHEEVLAAAERVDTEPIEGDDDLFPEAVRIVVEAGQASVSLLQRRLRIGYTRAGRLIDMMEERGFVGPHQGSKARDLRLTMDDYRRLFETDG